MHTRLAREENPCEAVIKHTTYHTLLHVCIIYYVITLNNDGSTVRDIIINK